MQVRRGARARRNRARRALPHGDVLGDRDHVERGRRDRAALGRGAALRLLRDPDRLGRVRLSDRLGRVARLGGWHDRRCRGSSFAWFRVFPTSSSFREDRPRRSSRRSHSSLKSRPSPRLAARAVRCFVSLDDRRCDTHSLPPALLAVALSFARCVVVGPSVDELSCACSGGV